jgi:hypothetical protein
MFYHLLPTGNRHQHALVAEAAECEDAYAECLSEQRAEDGYERWLEDGGPHAAAIQASYALDEEMERRNGVIPFHEAMAEAEFRHADERMWA